MIAETRLRRFTVEEYHRMGSASILADGERVELVDGEVVEMTPIGSRHADCVDRLNLVLVRTVGDSLVVRIQNPIRLGERSEPQPDAALVRLREGGYARSLPTRGDTILVIEVSDSTLLYDQKVKLPIYAGAHIPETWIIDIEAKMIERYGGPAEGEYRAMARAGRGEQLESLAAPGLILRTDDLLGE